MKTNDSILFIRQCPRCLRIIQYKSRSSLNRSIRDGRNCKRCQITSIWTITRKTTLDFINDSIKRHGGRYDYSRSAYHGVGSQIEIICRKHGSFLQYAGHHLQGRGCPKCMADDTGNRYRSNTVEFVSKAKLVHGEIYDYSKVNYIRNNKKVEIFCKKHGKYFWQTPLSHISGCGCPRCKFDLLTENGIMVDKGSIRFFENLKKVGLDQFIPNYVVPEINVVLDFYDPCSKIVIEFDSVYHSKPRQREKDRLREQRIIRFLHPNQFWRVEEMSKSFKNIMA